MVDETVALRVQSPVPVAYSPASDLETATNYQTSQLANQFNQQANPIKLQSLGRASAIEGIQYRNQLMSNAIARGITPDAWDAEMQKAADQGAPEATQWIGHYPGPVQAARIGQVYSGAPSIGTAQGNTAPAGSPLMGAAPPQDNIARQLQSLSPQQAEAALKRQTMLSDTLAGIRDQRTQDAAVDFLIKNGIPAQNYVGRNYEETKFDIYNKWRNLQPIKEQLQNIVSANLSGVPQQPIKTEAQVIGGTGYNPWTGKPMTPAEPKVVQDPILGPRTILPDKSGQWHYVDTNEPVVPSQVPPTTGGVSIGEAIKRLQPTENSTGNPAAKNTLSSAMGNHQFIDSTWLETIKAAHPELAKTFNDQQLLALRAVPALSESMAEQYATKNAGALASFGLPVTTETIALAHRFGPGGAKKILTANQNTPMEQIFPPKTVDGKTVDNPVVAANPELKGQTVGAYTQNLIKQVGSDPVNIGGGAVGTTTVGTQGAGQQTPLPGIPPSDDPARPFKKVTAPTSATMIKAQQLGLHGQAMLDAMPGNFKNDVEAVANYDAPITIFSKYGRAGISQDKALGWVRNVNPDYDMTWYSLKGTGLKNFYSSTSANSPLVQARTYNTAVGHAGELADGIRELHTANPGVFQQARNAGIPFLSYLAANAQQKMATGTPEGVAWAKINAVLPLYAGETEKFYTGNQGSEGEKKQIMAPYNANLSYPEMMTSLHTQKEMYKSKTAPLEAEYKDIFNAPGLSEYGTKKNVKQWNVARQSAIDAADKIDRYYNEARATGHPATPTTAVMAPASTANTPPVPGAKFFQGQWYTRGPNGEAVPVPVKQ